VGHSRWFSWVNLPATHKNDAPGYQTLLDRDIPSVRLPDGAGKLRVIAGEYVLVQGVMGSRRRNRS
jgi:quercetin 2,3-dioxygenase